MREGCPGCGRDHSVPPPPPVEATTPEAQAERKRAADLVRSEATAERNRAASWRADRTLGPAHERELCSVVAEEVAHSLDQLAQKIAEGAVPVWPTHVAPSVVAKKRRPF